MPGIVLQTNAIDVVNKGGGYPTKTFYETVETGILRKKIKFSRHMESTEHLPGSDYVVFKCPAPDCGQRNKQSVYRAKGQTKDGRLSLICNKCRREIEVQRPMGQVLKIEAPPKHEAGRPVAPGIILGPNGLPIRR